MKDYEFIREKEIIGRLESGFNCKIDHMRVDEGYVSITANVAENIDIDLYYDKGDFYPNSITGSVSYCKHETGLRKPADVNEYLGNVLVSIAGEHGFGVARDWADGVNVPNVYKALEMIRKVINDEAILD